jgi:L,D-peptidoglycan transpeptidase YkuD (ErfK/YbiS/YcfS/YnhG family)
MRKLSDDRGKVVAQSMGWCNNPESMNHNRLTAADHKMQKTGIWKKWGVI